MRLLDDAMVSVTTGEVSPLPRGSSTAGSSRRASTPSTCVGPRSGPRPSRTGASSNRTSCPSGASASCTGHRCCRRTGRGRTPQGRRGGRLPLPERRPGIPPSAPRSTSSASCTGSAASSPPPSAPTEKRAATDASRRPASSCCALAQGQVAAAVASIQRVVEETRGLRSHPAMLAAAVEILLAAGDAAAARRRVRGAREARRRRRRAAHPGRRGVLLRDGRCSPRGMPWRRIVELRRGERRVARARDAVRRGSSQRADRRCLPRLLGPRRRRPAARDRARDLRAPRGRTDLARAGRLARSRASLGVLTARQCDVLRAWPPASRTERWPRSSASASTPSLGTCRTSSPSSTCRRVRRPPPTPTSTGSSDRAHVPWSDGPRDRTGRWPVRSMRPPPPSYGPT